MCRLGNILLWNLMAAVILLGQARPNVKVNSQSSKLEFNQFLHHCYRKFTTPHKPFLLTGSGLHSDCVGNLMRLSLDKALVGNGLEVEAINGTQHILLTPNLAAQCGYSMDSDPWGNTRIYSSLLGCYVDNHVSHHIATPEAKGQTQDVKELDIIPDVRLQIWL
ncbi:hypothetical protein EYF80_040024 [Liparis tanakae]|uniref:Uncharacterized protein n=1 Tax=Liparis tanakae TaxID=230148 RepID=A0A4Z2G9C8_9TELE|nr:hypothetical protein EYF80_040024 [Liparis tanakae]